jgi:hypothetical protein
VENNHRETLTGLEAPFFGGKVRRGIPVPRQYSFSSSRSKQGTLFNKRYIRTHLITAGMFLSLSIFAPWMALAHFTP